FCCICLFLVSAVAWNFKVTTNTAYSWPSLDMASYFVAKNNPDLLKNDFFTICSLEQNPRQFFGELVLSLERIFDSHWYSVLYSMRVFFALLIPLLWFLLLTLWFGKGSLRI